MKVAHCRKYAPKVARIRIITNVIGPLFDYGSILYHGFGIHGSGLEAKKLQIAQNSCIRYIYNLSNREHITPFMRELGILNLFNRRIFLIACFVHKYIYFGAPPYLNGLLTINENNTRAGQDTVTFIVRNVNRSRDEYIFDNCVSRMWNEIPSQIRCIKKHGEFRNKLKFYLLQNQNEQPIS